jgi:hypothetical protein
LVPVLDGTLIPPGFFFTRYRAFDELGQVKWDDAWIKMVSFALLPSDMEKTIVFAFEFSSKTGKDATPRYVMEMVTRRLLNVIRETSIDVRGSGVVTFPERGKEIKKGRFLDCGHEECVLIHLKCERSFEYDIAERPCKTPVA